MGGQERANSLSWEALLPVPTPGSVADEYLTQYSKMIQQHIINSLVLHLLTSQNLLENPSVRVYDGVRMSKNLLPLCKLLNGYSKYVICIYNRLNII